MDLLLAYLAEIKRRSVHTYINTLSKTQSPSSHRLTLQPQLPQWRERESIWPHATFQFSIVTLANKNQQVWSLIFPSKKKKKRKKIPIKISCVQNQALSSSNSMSFTVTWPHVVHSTGKAVTVQATWGRSTVTFLAQHTKCTTSWFWANWSYCTKNIIYL